MRIITLFAVLAAAAATLASGYPAEPIRVVSSDHEIRFPSEIAFRLTAEGETAITGVKLHYRLSDGRVRVYGYPEFVAGTRVTADFSLKTDASNYLPTGVDVEYYYEITDSAGNTVETSRATVEYKDPRYRWRRVEIGDLTVLYHDLSASQVESVTARVVARLEAVKATFGLDSAHPMKAVLVNGRREAQRTFPLVSETATRGHVFGGYAYDQYDLFVLAGLWENGMVHEATHLLLDEAISSPLGLVPAWLNEGLATYFEGGPNHGESIVARAARNGGLLRLHAMNSVPGRPADIALFYSQARSIVEYMLGTYGRERMSALLRAIDDGDGTDAALRKAYGFGRDELEARWAAGYGVVLPERQIVERSASEAAGDAPLVFESPLTSYGSELEDKTEAVSVPAVSEAAPVEPAASEPVVPESAPEAPVAEEASATQSASRGGPPAGALVIGVVMLAGLAVSGALAAGIGRRRRAR
jgi:hypothetical protein